jgi:hypothetical protein
MGPMVDQISAQVRRASPPIMASFLSPMTGT